jgi:hypothetical protein
MACHLLEEAKIDGFEVLDVMTAQVPADGKTHVVSLKPLGENWMILSTRAPSHGVGGRVVDILKLWCAANHPGMGGKFGTG